jgi:glycolate oxidase
MSFLRTVSPRPSAAAIDKAKSRLSQQLGLSKLITEPDGLLAYAGDESENTPVLPDLVVLASSPEDIQHTLRIASEEGIFVTPRAGGSGKSGGAIPAGGGIVLATLGMNQIVDIDRDEHTALVEPGLILGKLHDAVEELGLFYPPDANSLTYCALGGNVAENAGGPRAFKYGTTRDYVLGLDVHLMGGESMFVGRRTKKGVTGYDVVGTLVGSEGTLAVTSRILLRLLPKPQSLMTLVATFDDAYACSRAVSEILRLKVVPRCIELLDRLALEAARSEGIDVDAKAGAMLLIELDGAEAALLEEAERAGEGCTKAGARDVSVAQDGTQRDRLWAARRSMSHATRRLAKYKVSEDVVVPRFKIGDLLATVDRIRERIGFKMLTYGHAGDGNLHVNYLYDDLEQEPLLESGLEELFREVVRLGGTLSGEHGIGLSKARFLPLEQPEPLIALQKRMKAAFDPQGLLNPGKIFAGSHRSC